MRSQLVATVGASGAGAPMAVPQRMIIIVPEGIGTRVSRWKSQHIQHTVDSILQAKIDSISHSSYQEKPVVVEVEKPKAWYQKVWDWIVGKFAWIGLIVVLGVILYFVLKRFLPK